MKDSTRDNSEVKRDPGNADPDPMVVNGLDEQVVNLDTVTPEADMGNLSTFREVFADQRIIGLGEATHGAREFFQLKHRLLRFFVKELGVRLIGLEADFAETLTIDRYVRHGEGSPEAVLENIHHWPWKTYEVINLIKWLRAFNAGRPPDDQVRFYGFDMQHIMGAAEAVADYLNRVNPQYLNNVGDGLTMLSESGLWARRSDGLARRLATADRIVPDLRATFEENRTEYISQSSESDWQLARQLVTVLRQATDYVMAIHTADGPISEESMRLRDKAMAENVAWILQHETAERIVVWAHNDHVNRVKTTAGGLTVESMGNHLAQQYDNSYYALGFEFGHGTFQAIDKSGKEGAELREHSLDNPLPSTVASVFTALDRPTTFLDLRTSKADPLLKNWLNEKHRLHWIGTNFNPEQPENFVQSYKLARAFDGLCYVDETTRARPFYQ